MSISEALPVPEIYFDPSGKQYYIRNDRGNYICVTEGILKRRLKQAGFSNELSKQDRKDGVLVTEIERILNEVCTSGDVEYAGPLAGHKVGAMQVEGRRVLVTEPPTYIEPVQGDWCTLNQLFLNLLGEEQKIYFFCWLKVAMQALRAARHRPGQVLCMAGPPGCGKSFAQNLITRLLGGRSAKPYQYMTGSTQFNSELFQAEHLMIEDEVASFDYRVRRALGSNLKAFVVNASQRCHPKNRPALTLYPAWRVSITLNDEPEDLMVLPPIGDSLADKMMLLRATKMPMPLPTETLEQWATFTRVIDAELPCFVHHLLREFEIPVDLRSQRYGVNHYHNPELLEMMNVLSPEAKLLEMVDSQWPYLFGDFVEEWEGRSSDLEAKLCDRDCKMAHEARKLMVYNTACGQFLGRLSKQYPARISSRILDGDKIWSVRKMGFAVEAAA